MTRSKQNLFIANVLNITADIYFIKGTKGLYERDNIKPVFGVRTIQ